MTNRQGPRSLLIAESSSAQLTQRVATSEWGPTRRRLVASRSHRPCRSVEVRGGEPLSQGVSPRDRAGRSQPGNHCQVRPLAHDLRTAISYGQQRSRVETCRLARSNIDIHSTCSKVECLSAHIGQSARSYDHRKKLHQLGGSRSRGKGEHVLVAFDGVITQEGRLGNLYRPATRPALPVPDRGRFAQALHATSAWSDNMRPAHSVPRILCAAPGSHHDTTIDHGNEVCT